MDLNKLAQKISEKEKGKVNLSIAQIKEVLRCFGDVCYELGDGICLEVCAKLYAAAKKRAESP